MKKKIVKILIAALLVIAAIVAWQKTSGANDILSIGYPWNGCWVEVKTVDDVEHGTSHATLEEKDLNCRSSRTKRIPDIYDTNILKVGYRSGEGSGWDLTDGGTNGRDSFNTGSGPGALGETNGIYLDTGRVYFWAANRPHKECAIFRQRGYNGVFRRIKTVPLTTLSACKNLPLRGRDVGY